MAWLPEQSGLKRLPEAFAGVRVFLPVTFQIPDLAEPQ